MLPAHRAVLVARCDVMAAMFSGKYAEARSRVVPIHGVSSDTFLSFLEYLYTDTCCPGGSTAVQEQKQAHYRPGPTHFRLLCLKMLLPVAVKFFLPLPLFPQFLASLSKFIGRGGSREGPWILSANVL